MVMATTTDRPIRLSDMTREEAETVTDQIKENFDSLGNMLIAARDRKAFRVLGYRSFEAYCQTEFGKSSSTAYQAIEDAKIRSQLEAHISENQGEEITLNFPSSHLRPLKGIENIEDKLKAIKYAQKLAARDGKRATKQHLEIAVFELSGKRSEEFRSAIQKLGFVRGTEVETLPPHKKERGIVRSIDKLGKVHVELFYGSIKHIEYDATQLRILTNEEKPANPLDGSVAKKDDRVLIYSEGLKGKQGTIYTWKEGKQALVMIDGEIGPDLIAYAEMERIKPEQKDTNWEADLSWETAKQTYYYFQKEDKIYSNKWPAGLTLSPFSRELSPIKFMAVWEENFAGQLLEGLITQTNLKTLVLAQAIELPEAEGKEFAADLIASLSQLFPQVPTPTKALGVSFSRTINELISGNKTQTRRAWQDDYAKNFIRYFEEDIAIPALDKGRHRGGIELGFIKLTQRPYQQYLSEMSPIDLQEEGGMVATAQEFIDTFFEGQDKLVWVLHFEALSTPVSSDTNDESMTKNQQLLIQLAEAGTTIQAMIAASTAPPLELEQTADFLLENTSDNPAPGESVTQPELPSELVSQIDSIRNKFLSLIENYEKTKKATTKKKEIDNLNDNIDTLQKKLENLKNFEQFRIGNTICHQRRVIILGKITGLEFTQDEMPIVWVKYYEEGKLQNTASTEIVRMIFVVEDAATTDSPTTKNLDQDNDAIIAAKRERIEKDLEALTQNSLQTSNEKKIKKIRADIRIQESRREDIDNFTTLEIGDAVIRKIYPDRKGIIDKLEISTTGLLTVWVVWPQKYEGEPNSPEEHNVGTLTKIGNVDGGEK